MKKLLTLLVLGTLLTLTACEEKGEVGEYDNWEDRNIAFIDSIAKVAEQNADSRWMILKAYNLGDSASLYKGNRNLFVYAHKQKDGTGTVSPLFNDSVRVHYSGRLMPTELHPQGLNFDKSYSGQTLDEETDVPYLNRTGSYVVGFTTALMHMKEGDNWTIYIPAYLGYGATSTSSIPEQSALIFDVQLARIYHYGYDTDTSWH